MLWSRQLSRLRNALKVVFLRPQDWSRLKPSYQSTITAVKVHTNLFGSSMPVIFDRFCWHYVCVWGCTAMALSQKGACLGGQEKRLVHGQTHQFKYRRATSVAKRLERSENRGFCANRFARVAPTKKKTKQESSSEQVFLNNFCSVPDSYHREACRKSSCKHGVFLVFLDLGWVIDLLMGLFRGGPFSAKAGCEKIAH